MKKVEGMLDKPKGGAGRAPFGKNLMPTNETKATGGRVTKVLKAIKHVGRPGKGGEAPFK